ncbi:MAG: type II secretion system protein [Hydrogenoanaerobacterium sp.]
MKKNKKNGGYTLVEVIVSVALFVIGAAMLASSILAAGSMFRTGTNIKSYGQRAAAVAEGADGDGFSKEVADGGVSFTIEREGFTKDENTVTMNVLYTADYKNKVAGENDKPQITFYTFKSKK